MKKIAALCAASLVLAGCASTPSQNTDAVLPVDVGNGIGSQFGNYEMRAAGETRDAEGNRCVVFNWDRPLNRNFAIRYSSASCESKDHPAWMKAMTYTRSVIPLAQSNLAVDQAEGALTPSTKSPTESR